MRLRLFGAVFKQAANIPGISLIAGVAVVLSVLIWSIFRTGQTAIKKEAARLEQPHGHTERPA